MMKPAELNNHKLGLSNPGLQSAQGVLRGTTAMFRRINFSGGFSMAEILITVGILVVVIVSLFQLFIYCSSLAQLSIDITKSVVLAQSKMEEIRQYNYDLIPVDYVSTGTPGNTFSFTSGVGKGVIYINSTNTDLLQVDVVVSWQEPNQRIIGEDLNFNGALDGGEDVNGNGVLDSPVHFTTLIARK